MRYKTIAEQGIEILSVAILLKIIIQMNNR